MNEITPLIAARTDKALVAAAAKRHARWERIVLESAQQSRRLRPPKIAEATALEQVYRDSSAACKILLSERSDAPPIHDVLRDVKAQSAEISIGPEGGWTDSGAGGRARCWIPGGVAGRAGSAHGDGGASVAGNLAFCVGCLAKDEPQRRKAGKSEPKAARYKFEALSKFGLTVFIGVHLW